MNTPDTSEDIYERLAAALEALSAWLRQNTLRGGDQIDQERPSRPRMSGWLANTMMPEAFEHGGKLAGMFTVPGFELSLIVVLLEKA